MAEKQQRKMLAFIESLEEQAVYHCGGRYVPSNLSATSVIYSRHLIEISVLGQEEVIPELKSDRWDKCRYRPLDAEKSRRLKEAIEEGEIDFRFVPAHLEAI